jgi:hypothetical protein
MQMLLNMSSLQVLINIDASATTEFQSAGHRAAHTLAVFRNMSSFSFPLSSLLKLIL